VASSPTLFIASSLPPSGIPPEKRFQRFMWLEPGDFVHPSDRSESYVIVELVAFTGRYADTKRALIRGLYENWGKTGGSRRRFAHSTAAMISLHKPHPGNELKAYQVELVLETLIQEGLI
jgi:hypothetical protein